MITRRVRVAVLLLVALVLAACSTAGGDPASTPSRVAPHRAAASTPAPPASSSTPAAQRRPDPCRANAHGKQVRVNLHAQHLWMCRGRHVAFSTAITSGMTGPDTHTPTGDYRIQGLNRNSTLTLNTGRQYQVKYWIPFQAPLFGFHDASWQHFPFGSARYRTHGSHGCVHMPLHAIAFLYRWAKLGTRVHIRA